MKRYAGVAIAAVVVATVGVGSAPPEIVPSAFAQGARSAAAAPTQPMQNSAPAAPQAVASQSEAGAAAIRHAEEAFQAQNAPPPATAKAPVVELASAVHPEDKPGPGELVRTIKRYVHWVQVCDALLGKRQVCFLEQRVVAEDGVGLTWQVAQGVDGHVKAILRGPVGLSPEVGLKISFDGFDRTEKALSCEKGECVVVLPFEGRIGEWVMSAPELAVGFEINHRPYIFHMSLDGFRMALDAIPKGGESVTASVEPSTGKASIRSSRKSSQKRDEPGVVQLSGRANGF